MQRRISTIAGWIDSGVFVEGNEPLPKKSDQEEFFNDFCKTLTMLGWLPILVAGRAIYEECLFEKGKDQYRLTLVDNRSYKINKEI